MIAVARPRWCWRERGSIANLRAMGIRTLRSISAVALALLCAISARGASTDASYADVRKAFQEAYARVTANIADSGAADSESLKSYPLYPYLQAARIEQALDSESVDRLAEVDKRAGDFIALYGQQPVAR